MVFVTDTEYFSRKHTNKLYDILANGGILKIDRKALVVKQLNGVIQFSIADIKGHELPEKIYLEGKVRERYKKKTTIVKAGNKEVKLKTTEKFIKDNNFIKPKESEKRDVFDID